MSRRRTSSVPCRHFQNGYCWNGDDCRFQHSEGPSTAPTSSNPNARPPGPSTAPFSAPFNPIPKAFSKKERAPEECLDWYLTGSCPRYRTCRYAHPSNLKEEERFGNRKASGKGFGDFDFLANCLSLYENGATSGGIFDGDDDEGGQRLRNGGFTDDDVYELSLQGIKPWDAEAGAALAVMKGLDLDDGYGYGYDDDYGY